MWTLDNFILPAPPTGGLPTSQDQLDRMKLVCDHTVPISFPSGMNITINFKIIGYTNFSKNQLLALTKFSKIYRK